jgi:hypothetical protein
MKFINAIQHFFEDYEKEEGENLVSEERLAVELFAEWLDENTDSEFFFDKTA